MPGSALYDYGDSIRFGANTGAEDEKDLSKISCDLELFALYTKGFIEGCGGSLTEKEIRLLPMGAKLMTLECGILLYPVKIKCKAIPAGFLNKTL